MLGYDTHRLERDFAYNIRAGLSILRSLLEERGDQAEALCAYNGGRGWRSLSGEAQRAVRRYAAQVLERKARYGQIGCARVGTMN